MLATGKSFWWRGECGILISAFRTEHLCSLFHWHFAFGPLFSSNTNAPSSLQQDFLFKCALHRMNEPAPWLFRLMTRLSVTKNWSGHALDLGPLPSFSKICWKTMEINENPQTMWLSAGPRATYNEIHPSVKNLGTSRDEGCPHHRQPLQRFAQSPPGKWPPVCSGRGAGWWNSIEFWSPLQNPFQVLADMSKAGVKPDKETFQCLISRHCQVQ